jgi:hypothetical protein
VVGKYRLWALATTAEGVDVQSDPLCFDVIEDHEKES